MENRIPESRMSIVLNKALKLKVLDIKEDTAIIFYDFTFLEERIKRLIELFPESTLHAIAVKANPLVKILTKLKDDNIGAEVATLPELYLAEKSGFSADKIVFDSPAKTYKELEYALNLGIHINADSLFELERIDKILKNKPSSSKIGIRINPQVGTGSIQLTSVAGKYSKFGVPVSEFNAELTDAFLKYDWLVGVHEHVGSQGCSLDMLLKGIEVVLDFVKEVNKELKLHGKSRKIEIFDLGGGLPVSYYKDNEPIAMQEYVQAIKYRFGELFTDKFKLITEFGRYIFANSGWAASKVEYVKKGDETETIMIHLGADLFLRRCYRPEDWHHEMTVADSNGCIKGTSKKRKYTIAGPLCFAGDIIARDIELSEVTEGDYIIIHDTGAYTLSLWSRHNSRQIPKVAGYYGDGENFEILKERESLDDIFKFWS